MNNEKYNLNHTVLYAKGHYQTSEEPWKDVAKCLVRDQLYQAGDIKDVVKFLANYIPSHAEELGVKPLDAFDVVSIVCDRPDNGKTVEEELLSNLLSVLRFAEKGEWQGAVPLSDVLPLNKF